MIHFLFAFLRKPYFNFDSHQNLFSLNLINPAMGPAHRYSERALNEFESRIMIYLWKPVFLPGSTDGPQLVVNLCASLSGCLNAVVGVRGRGLMHRLSRPSVQIEACKGSLLSYFFRPRNFRDVGMLGFPTAFCAAGSGSPRFLIGKMS